LFAARPPFTEEPIMPTAEIIKTETLPNGRRRHFILVDLAADQDRAASAASTTAPTPRPIGVNADGTPG
jgi:hypothetical protein